jgi:hypothetical protein
LRRFGLQEEFSAGPGENIELLAFSRSLGEKITYWAVPHLDGPIPATTNSSEHATLLKEPIQVVKNKARIGPPDVGAKEFLELIDSHLDFVDLRVREALSA